MIVEYVCGCEATSDKDGTLRKLSLCEKHRKDREEGKVLTIDGIWNAWDTYVKEPSTQIVFNGVPHFTYMASVTDPALWGLKSKYDIKEIEIE